ncbi:MAG TPA: DNA polymerase IV, partial [Candidatus Limnocylindrales bacterium]|nr:DNA polymerase IV [Candidatus Limnocylindrales bacterium]
MSRSQITRPQAPTGLGEDDAGCPILHVDMDAFFASVEVARRPELRGKAMIVGGVGSRGVVVAATYEARQYGIHSAMPMSRALRLAPDIIVVPPDHSHYAEVSASVMELFTAITARVEVLGLDEAFLDVSGARRTHGSPRAIAEMIRAQVHDEQGITCSVGVAPTKFVAKLASTQCKPDGLLVVPADRVISFLHPMPVGALWGVGERTEEQLHRLGLRTVADIAHTPRATLIRALGQASGAHLAELAWGRD